MQTNLADFVRDTPEGREADAILRACVHCGFCNATCPTYQLLGDELDGPRGRIYLMKQMLEGQPVSAVTRDHLDRCLGCRNCETTCPSGVQYGRLIDIGRAVVERLQPRSVWERILRAGLRRTLTAPAVFGPLYKLGQGARGLLPAGLRAHLAAGRVETPRPATPPSGSRRVLILDGCVQPAMSPDINRAAIRVLARLDVQVVSAAGAGCCGAIDQHLAAPEAARAAMRRNIDAWWPHVEAGAEAIVITASGCGSLVKEYGHHLRDDPRYAAKAARIAALAQDLCQVLAREDLSRLGRTTPRRIAFHPPCSLCHGQRVQGVAEAILAGLGHELVVVADAHLCCGSAGTYSLLQPRLADQLRRRKLANLKAQAPELIATANIGCQNHLAAASDVPVVHWITLLDR